MSDTSPNLKLSYLADLNLLESPLVGLLGKPAETFTEEELRDFVREIRTLRESAQSRKAAMTMRARGEVVEPKSARLFDEF